MIQELTYRQLKKMVRGGWGNKPLTSERKANFWNKIARRSERVWKQTHKKSKLQPLPDYDTFCDGMRER